MRWIEYALSSSVMIVIIAALAGIWFSTTAPFDDRDRPWDVWTMDLMLSTTLHLYFWCYWLIIAAVHFFDQAENVAHAENPGNEPIRVERLQGSSLLANAQELDGFAGYRFG